MEPVPTEKRVSITGKEQEKALALILVNELLAIILADQNETILFRARSQGFLYDTESGMETSGMLKTRVENANIIEKESEIELTGLLFLKWRYF